MVQCRRIGWSFVVNVYQGKEPSPYNSTAVCIFSGWSASSAGSVARSSINIMYLSTALQSVCAPVCSAALRCVFDTTQNYWVQHWYCCNAAPSFSEHTYYIPLRDALWVIYKVRGTLCCTLNGCKHSIERLPPYCDITKSPIGWSTAPTPIGRSFEIGRSKSRCTIPPCITPPTEAYPNQALQRWSEHNH